MDIDTNISEEQYCERQHNAAVGLGLRYVTPIQTDDYPVERFVKLWQGLETQPQMFDDFSRGDIKRFVESWHSPTVFNFELGNFEGWCALRNAFEGSSAELHYITWSSKFDAQRAVQAGNEVCNFAFNRICTQRITGPIPSFNKAAQRLATLMGFKFEGELRSAFKYEAKYFGMSLWGMTVEDWTRRQDVRRQHNNHN